MFDYSKNLPGKAAILEYLATLIDQKNPKPIHAKMFESMKDLDELDFLEPVSPFTARSPEELTGKMNMRSLWFDRYLDEGVTKPSGFDKTFDKFITCRAQHLHLVFPGMDTVTVDIKSAIIHPTSHTKAA